MVLPKRDPTFACKGCELAACRLVQMNLRQVGDRFGGLRHRPEHKDLFLGVHSAPLSLISCHIPEGNMAVS